MELLDLVDVNGNLLGRTIERGNKNFKDGEYIKLVTIFLKSNDKYLLQLTSKEKDGLYAVTGGHVPSGSTSKEHALVECKEELGIDLDIGKLRYIGKIVKGHAIFESFVYEDNSLDKFEFVFQKEEVENAYWLTKEEIEILINKNLVRGSTSKQFNELIKR